MSAHLPFALNHRKKLINHQQPTDLQQASVPARSQDLTGCWSGPDYWSGQLQGNVSKNDPTETKRRPWLQQISKQEELSAKVPNLWGPSGPLRVRGGWAAGRGGEVNPLINKSSLCVLFCPAEMSPIVWPADEESTSQFSLGRVEVPSQ